MGRLILISGTPASGKDTITEHMIKNNNQLAHFKKHKGGAGGKMDDSYHHVSISKFKKMAAEGDFLQYHFRYGRGYGVSVKVLKNYWANGLTPIIHVGDYKNIEPFYCLQDTEIISVLLLADLNSTIARLNARYGNRQDEVTERLVAYHEERETLLGLMLSGKPIRFDYVLNNSHNAPEHTALQILNLTNK